MNKLKILIVEDESEQIEIFELLLSASYELTIVSTPSEGLKAFHESRPDVVLMDIRLPEYSGFGLIQQLKEIDPQVRSIVVTAFSNEANTNMAMKLGCFAFIKKRDMSRRLIGEIEEASAGTPEIVYSYDPVPPPSVFQLAERLPLPQKVERLATLAQRLPPAQKVEHMVMLAETLTPARRAEFLALLIARLEPEQKTELTTTLNEKLGFSWSDRSLVEAAVRAGGSDEGRSAPPDVIRLQLKPTPEQITQIENLFSLYKRAVLWVEGRLPAEGTPRQQDLQQEYYDSLAREFPELHAQHLARILGMVVDRRKRPNKRAGIYSRELGEVALFDTRALRFLLDKRLASMALPPKEERRTHVAYEGSEEELPYLPKALRKYASLFREKERYWLEVLLD